jgi:branched-chain amino acid transport system permease protein
MRCAVSPARSLVVRRACGHVLLLAAVLAAAGAACFGSSVYLHEVLIVAVLHAQYAASWDLFSGPTELDNFGHALFIGMAAYGSALLGRHLGLSPWLSVPAGAVAAALLGAVIGALTLRLRGPYFSLATLACAAVGFKLAYLLSGVTGGEEGLSGLRTFTGEARSDLLVCLLFFSMSMVAMMAFQRSRQGLILRATRHNEEAAQACGLGTARCKVQAFMLSGFLAGIGGGLHGHTQMQVNPELLSGSLCVLVVLLATVGGRGTLVGPALAAAVLALANEGLRAIEPYRALLFTGSLIVLVWLVPDGLVAALREAS